MVQQKEAKNTALFTAAIITLMSFIYVPDWTMVGVAKGSPLAARFVYSFFHASFLHALINAWCLLSIVFLYEVSIWRLLTAYIIAILVPDVILSDIPTVGLSCICYFLLGSLIFAVKRKLYFITCMATYIAIGFLFPSVNALIHVYGFIAGFIVGLLNAPLSCLRK